MKKRDLTKQELELIINFYLEGDPYLVPHEKESFEKDIREDIEKNSVILYGVDTKVGTYVIHVILIVDEDGFVDKTVIESMIRFDNKVEDVKDWDYISYVI